MVCNIAYESLKWFFHVYQCWTCNGRSLPVPSPTMKVHLLAGLGDMSLQTMAIVIFCLYGKRLDEDSRISKVSRIRLLAETHRYLAVK